VLKLTFFGVRGSCPCCDEGQVRYGGNTSCIVLEAGREAPLVLDMGTGFRVFGASRPPEEEFRGTALLTHLHWDHVQGLPFFQPADRKGCVLDVYGPGEPGRSLAEAMSGLIRPPYFPVDVSELRGDVRFHDAKGDLTVGSAKVKARPVPHFGNTLGYRVEVGGATVAYVSDHQAPQGFRDVPESVLELCDSADLVVHDAQYTLEEFSNKANWGHSTVEYAVTVARASGARRLAMFHHDPSHGDGQVDDMLERARCLGAAAGLDDVIAASEGLTLDLGRA
jgi:phosphoribosyl 1,2-cyclic phosphodiesterase